MKIRSYDQQVGAQGAIQGPQANAGDFGGQTAAAEGDFAHSGYESADILTQLAEAKDQVWRNNTASAFQLDQYNQMQQAKTDPDFAKKYGADGAGFTAGITQNLDDSIANVSATASSPRSQRLLTQQLNEVKTSLIGHAISFQAQTGGAYMSDQLGTMMQNDAKMVSQDPSMTSAVLDRGKTAIANAPLLEPDKKAELLKSYEQNIALSAGKGLVLHSPEKVLAAIAPDVLAGFKPTAKVLDAEGKGSASTTPITTFDSPQGISPATQGYTPAIQSAAATHGVSASFLSAQIDTESRGNPSAINNNDVKVTGSPSMGIAQFQPATAAQYGVTNPNDPKQAIPGMAAYMSDLLKQFGGDYRKAAIAYNWGPGNVTKAIATYGDQWMQHTPQSSQDYLNTILQKAAPIGSAPQSLAAGQEQQAEAQPSQAPTNPDWFNKLNWEQQFSIVHEAEQGVRANQVRDAQTLALQQEQKKALDQKTMNEMFNRIGADQNPLTVADVRSSNLDYQGKEHMLTAINAVTRGENATDPKVFSDTFQRIHAADGDPNKISNPDDLIPMMGRGLSFEDVQKLRGEITGKNTPDGAMQADLKKNLFSMAKKQIDSSIFGVSIDSTGAQNFYKFQQAAMEYIDKSTKAGKSVHDIYSPDSKDYVGKLIPLFTRSIQQQQEDVANSFTKAGQPTTPAATSTPTPPATPTEAPPPRLLNETPADYLKRTKKV